MKGRPPVIPRIKALERLYADAQVRITQLENAVLELAEAARDARKPYVQQFTQWPSKNGSP